MKSAFITRTKLIKISLITQRQRQAPPELGLTLGAKAFRNVCTLLEQVSPALFAYKFGPLPFYLLSVWSVPTLTALLNPHGVYMLEQCLLCSKRIYEEHIEDIIADTKIAWEKKTAVLSTLVTTLRSAFGHEKIQTVDRIVISHAVPAKRDYEWSEFLAKKSEDSRRQNTNLNMEIATDRIRSAAR